MKNILSVDLEDWYHTAYLRDFTNKPRTKDFQILDALSPVLKLFERNNLRVTFFVLGDVAIKHPDAIEKILDHGHEIASHGFSHKPLWELSQEDFEKELLKTNKILKRITKKRIFGFRAPYFSVMDKTSWAIDILEKNKFKYDSSVFPMKTPLYGSPGAPLDPYNPKKGNIMIEDKNRKFKEYPLSVFEFMKLRLPACGGFYFRLFPLDITKLMIRKMNKNGRIVNFFFHPWETYPNTFRLEVPIKNRFITYHGLKKSLKRIEILVNTFNFHSFEDDLSKN